MEREQNSVDFKEESTLEQAPESLDETLRSVLPIFVAFFGLPIRGTQFDWKRNKMWEAGKAVGGCKFARECFKIRCFPRQTIGVLLCVISLTVCGDYRP